MYHRLWIMGLAISLAASACGDDSNANGAANTGGGAGAAGQSGGSGGPGAGGSNGGSGGGTAAGGSSASGAPGAGGAIQTVTCGGVECPVPLTAACCVDDACGFTDDATGGCEPLVECGGEQCVIQGPGVCCDGNICGLLDEMTGECGDPLGGFRDGGTEVEPIVTDPACGDMDFGFLGQTLTLSGCCDQTGVCGGNTGDLPPLAGLSLPTLCLTPAEGQQLFLTGPMTAVPCGDGGGSPPPDAGSPAPDATAPGTGGAAADASSD